MYRDKSLIPTEAIRMLALGILAGGPCRYAELAAEVRHFSSRIVGPSLDILGSSLELLSYEGLMQPLEGRSGSDTGLSADAMLSITDTGRVALHDLLRSHVRAPVDDINKLVVALKIRFLHVLSPAEQREQIEGLIDICETELGRLEDLAEHHENEPGHLLDWLAHDMGQIRERIEWLKNFGDTAISA